ncbi:hypothetical protein SAMN05216218_11940 [Halorientalis regularis]|uniref:Uncharacterized protein n=1 Tax=Halorientalis regularis TaxID=660518 RepID=A0A1G7SMZ6_9EURY|nr:hypothetical protein SAMN05216218_11940 [Halorientalis regularis]
MSQIDILCGLQAVEDIKTGIFCEPLGVKP